MSSLRTISFVNVETKAHDGPSDCQSLMVDDSTPFHELDESRWSKYDYSEECDSICDEFETRVAGAECDGSICSLGKSMRERYVPRSIYTQDEEEEDNTQSVQVPLPGNDRTSSRRELLASTKVMSPKPGLANAAEHSLGGVWKSMRSMGFGHEHHKDDKTENTGLMWKSMKAMTFSHVHEKTESTTEESQSSSSHGNKSVHAWNSFSMLAKGTPLEDDSDTQHGSTGAQDVTEPSAVHTVPRRGLTKSLSFKRALPSATKSMPRLTRPSNNKTDYPNDNEEKKETTRGIFTRTTNLKRSSGSSTQLDNLNQDKKNETRRGVLSKTGMGMARAASFKIKRTLTHDGTNANQSQQEIPMPELKRSITNEDATPSRGLMSRNSSIKRGTSFKIKRSLMKDSSNDTEENKGNNSMLMLQRATSFKLKRVFSTNDAAAMPMPDLHRSTSFKMNRHTTPVA